MNTYTIFCRQSNGQGTTWISTVEGETVEEAKKEALFHCSWDWGYESTEGIVVIGVAEGVVNIIEWEDLE